MKIHLFFTARPTEDLKLENVNASSIRNNKDIENP